MRGYKRQEDTFQVEGEAYTKVLEVNTHKEFTILSH